MRTIPRTCTICRQAFTGVAQRRLCDECRSARARKARQRRAHRDVVKSQNRPPILPGIPEWLRAHGIDPTVWKERGVWRYTEDDIASLCEAFAPWTRVTRSGRAVPYDDIIRRIVRQADGLFLPKHAPAGYPPIPGQLRPDREIFTNPAGYRHVHHDGPGWPDPWPSNGNGQPVVPQQILRRGAGLEAHVFKGASTTSAPYDPRTGRGDHKGVLVNGLHYHAPEPAKYILLGSGGISSRIDLHPRAERLLPSATRVFFVLEGTLKNDAILSAGECVISVPSVTVWTPNEVRQFAREHLIGKTVYVVPDADWIENPLVDQQALFVRTLLRWEGVLDSFIAAAPVASGQHKCECKPVGLVVDELKCVNCGGFLKGVDDWLGAGGSIEGMQIRGRESQVQRLYATGNDSFLSLDRRRRRRAWRALDGISLHAHDGVLNAPLRSLQKVMGISRRRVVADVLHDLVEVGAVTVDRPLDMYLKRDLPGSPHWEWIVGDGPSERPTISVADRFQAVEASVETVGKVVHSS